MIMLSLPESDVRAMMNLLLAKDAFDGFDLRNCVVQSFARFDIEGAVQSENAEPVSDGAKRKLSYSKWGRIRPYVLNVIKGNEKPRFFKVVLSLADERLEKDYPDAQALFINIVFDKNLVHITTGASMKTFNLVRGQENEWDAEVFKLLKGFELNVTEE